MQAKYDPCQSLCPRQTSRPSGLCILNLQVTVRVPILAECWSSWSNQCSFRALLRSMQPTNLPAITCSTHSCQSPKETFAVHADPLSPTPSCPMHYIAPTGPSSSSSSPSFTFSALNWPRAVLKYEGKMSELYRKWKFIRRRTQMNLWRNFCLIFTFSCVCFIALSWLDKWRD